ncbi:hypothetical protein NIES2119_29985 [[Phormidium ambiguum] IAM M-71]|uniref:PD-(D/E)XK endonuclease-like domain-containing protein n=1 Tax=[Phormidium ambiguum] IAM M-71 TaxID=454136 RepID=A0A1U7I416_9CYAN|nr:hypothetical protein [Phormidium ambiguum]OKH30905.1 hypothetical protein NIES2119_29985 [Phormidium ambiguum IAM M-71]
MNYLRLNAEDLFYLENSGCLYSSEIISPASASARCLGEQFHLIMQQSLMGMPIDSLLNNHSQLKQWFSGLQLLAPEIWCEEANTGKSYSHQVDYFYDDVILTSTFDLLISKSEQLEIVNWTTDTLNLTDIQWQWRTGLDLFLLAQTDTYLPEQIQLTYWLLNHSTLPMKFSIHYSNQALLAFKTKLERTLSKLPELFPKAVVTSGNNENNQHSQKSLFPSTFADRSRVPSSPKEFTFSQPVPETNETIEDSLSQFLSGRLTIKEYIDSVPEVEL